MSFMKKYISSVLLILLVIILNSCSKKEEFYIFKKDYFLSGDKLDVKIYSNVDDSIYFNIKNIQNSYIIDNDTNEVLPVNMKITNNGKVKKDKLILCEYSIIIDDKNLTSVNLFIKNASLKLEYINQKELNIKIGALINYNVIQSYDVRVNNIKTVLFNGSINKVVFELENIVNKEIQILDIKLITNKFEAENKKIKAYYKNNEVSLKDVVLMNKQQITIEIPIKKISNLSVKTMVIISYLIDNEIKYKVIPEIVLSINNQIEMETFYVSN